MRNLNSPLEVCYSESITYIPAGTVTPPLLSPPQIVYPFVHEVPFITVSTLMNDQRHSAVLGNVLNPSYASSLQMGYAFPMSVWKRFKNAFFHLWLAFYWRKWAVVPRIQEEVSWLCI